VGSFPVAKKKETPAPIAPRLLNIEMAAQYLSTTAWAMRKLAWSKDVPHIRLGTRILFDKQDLDMFIARAKQGGKFGTCCNAAVAPR
jgi:excisionase family DNA binding protein